MSFLEATTLSYKEIYFILKNICTDDCYLQEWAKDFAMHEIIYTLDSYGIIYISSDDRILLTSLGEKFYQHLSFAVEITKIKSNIPIVNLL